MDLRRRLARLDHLTRKPTPAPEAAAGPVVPDAAPDHAGVLAGALGLAPQETDAGTLWARIDHWPEVRPPAGDLPDLRGVLPSPPATGTPWDGLLLLDLETTGLMGGTGTLPFLVGLTWWEPCGLVTRQLFLDRPGREGPLMAEVARRAAGSIAVVTYNGASFDLPLLRTRARLLRQEDPTGLLAGCDLLPAARRLWGRRLPDCRQQTVERFLRGESRGPGDIDGALIPAAYRTFLRDGAASLLPEVLRHNRRDLVGMGEILRAVAHASGQLDPAAGRHAGAVHWAEAWSRALICERRREPSAAAGWVRAMLAAAPRPLPAPARRDAVRLLKRVRAWHLVSELVATGLAEDPRDAALHYEAAVLWEHRLGDPARALAHAEALGDGRRLARLRRRLAAGGCPGDEAPL